MTVVSATKFKIELWFITILCIAAIFVEFLAFLPGLRPSTESAASWIQRSGAITSIFSVFAQFRLNNFAESIKGTTFAESWKFYFQFKTHQYVMSWVIAAITVWGALVWGYGDLIFKLI